MSEYFDGADIALAVEAKEGLDKFGQQSSKFDGLPSPMSFNHACLSLANGFAATTYHKPGWYRATLVYKIGDNSMVERIDELKVVFNGEDKP